jgi:hypothetical protein
VVVELVEGGRRGDDSGVWKMAMELVERGEGCNDED